LRPILIFLAIIFLIEAWLWDRLEPIVAWIVARIPLEALKRRLAAWIDHLPPPATLIVFVVPFVFLLPLKLFGLWLVARGELISATGVLILAKVVGLAITAFVFDITREKLLLMPWFSVMYYRVLAWRAWAHALVAPIKRRIKIRMRLLLPGQSRRAFRLWKRIRRIRRRMQVPATAAAREPL
jgi:hypothetical protein